MTAYTETISIPNQRPTLHKLISFYGAAQRDPKLAEERPVLIFLERVYLGKMTGGSILVPGMRLIAPKGANFNVYLKKKSEIPTHLLILYEAIKPLRSDAPTRGREMIRQLMSDQPPRTTMMYSRQEIASYAGISRQTLMHTLDAMIKDGYLSKIEDSYRYMWHGEPENRA
jgi:hypothetical protein